jgi:hypothetical protein
MTVPVRRAAALTCGSVPEVPPAGGAAGTVSQAATRTRTTRGD